MANAAHPLPPLLALPRELRDLIYSYLHAEEDPPWRETSLFPPSCLLYRIHNAPNLGILHAHPRLREEYLVAIKKLGLSVTLCDRNPVERLSTNTLPELLVNRELHTLSLDTLFAQFVKHVTILVVTSHNNLEEWTWNTTKRLASVLLRKGPHLSTLRIDSQYHPTTLLQHHNNTYALFETTYFMVAPPSKLEALQLVQRVEGYRLEQAPSFPGQHRPQHRCVKYGSYLYAKSGADYHSHLWKPSDAIHQFWLEPYVSHRWDTPLPTSVVRHEMKEWREKRGHEEVVAWF
jgi:hypothetical protein